jgi:hypothetical protein
MIEVAMIDKTRLMTRDHFLPTAKFRSIKSNDTRV